VNALLIEVTETLVTFAGVAPVAVTSVHWLVLTLPEMKAMEEVLYVTLSPMPMFPVWAREKVAVPPAIVTVGLPVMRLDEDWPTE
jgi:hypothetical protein